MEEMSLVEVAPAQIVPNRWREFLLDTGAAQSTLQDIKLAESAGGFSYRHSNAWSMVTSNRFIYWKTNNDVLELTEVSTDYNLTGNQIKLRFQNTPVLEGVSIHETSDQVYILVATVASVHRFVFPHPHKLGTNLAGIDPQRSMSPRSLLTSTSLSGLEYSRPSIFSSAYSDHFHDPSTFHVLNSSSNSSLGMPFPITSCSWLTQQREAVFVLANSAGSLLVVRLGSPQDSGKVISWELKQTTIMTRLWNGFVPSLIRGNQEGEDAAVSLVSSTFHDDYLIFALCRDLRLRTWSYLRQECILVHNVLQGNTEGFGIQKENLPMAVRRPVLRKASNGDTANFTLVAFIAADQKQFFVLDFVGRNKQYEIRTVATINVTEDDLVDFVLTNELIYSLWLNSESELIISHCPLDSCGIQDWKHVVLHSHFVQSSNVNSLFVDPREHFIQDIFWSGKFSLRTISKAISILSRIPESSLIACKIDLLIEEATKIVENKIRSQVGAMELSAEEYTNLELDSWEKLYYYCVQYHDVGNKPLGLFLDWKTGAGFIIKRSKISFMRNNELIDHAILNTKLERQLLTSLVGDETAVGSSVNAILASVRIISQVLKQEDHMEFEALLVSGESAQKIAEEMSENKLLGANYIDPDSEEVKPLEHAFDKVFLKAPLICEAIEVINKALDLDLSSSTFWESSDIDSLTLNDILMQYMQSNSGLAIVTESLKQISRSRYNFCRDFLLWQIFILSLRNTYGFTSDKIEKIRSLFIPTTSLYVNSYYLMCWICETSMVTNGANVLGIEDHASQLALLELNEYNINRANVQSQTITTETGPRTILTAFLQNHGGLLTRKLVSQKFTLEEQQNSTLNWNLILPQYLTCTAQLIWPFTEELYLPEFLLGFGQYDRLQEYIRLVDIWSPLIPHSRTFLRAFCYLVQSEPSKAVILFNQSVSGITVEPFLKKFVGFQNVNFDFEDLEDNMSMALIYKYYSKILQLFSLYSHHQSIIELTNHALCLLDEEKDPDYEEHLSCFMMKLFVNHLELGNTSEAYQAMILNPEISLKKDCLRQFILDHCEKNRLTELVSFSYNDIEDEFVSIIESRARSTDLLSGNESNYYQLLYSYFVFNDNYRRAASVMFEYARRLGQEVPGTESLSKQVMYYSVTLNCLKIVNEKYSWIVKPSSKNINVESPNSSLLKRNHDGKEMEEAIEDSPFKRTIEVLDSEDVKREYELVRARLKLLEKDPKGNEIANSCLKPHEIIALLINSSLYDIAFNLSTLFKLSYEPIFEGLIAKYTELMQATDKEITTFYECFSENDTICLGHIASSENTLVEKFWNLITIYLEKYDFKGQSILHRCVAEKLLSLGIPIPTSLKYSYQKRNCPELLRLLITYNFIEEAVHLCMNYIDAFLGVSTELFDIQCPVMPKVPPLYIPHQHIQCLLKILSEESKENKHYKQLYAELNNQMKSLVEKVRSASRF